MCRSDNVGTGGQSEGHHAADFGRVERTRSDLCGADERVYGFQVFAVPFHVGGKCGSAETAGDELGAGINHADLPGGIGGLAALSARGQVVHLPQYVEFYCTLSRESTPVMILNLDMSAAAKIKNPIDSVPAHF